MNTTHFKEEQEITHQMKNNYENEYIGFYSNEQFDIIRESHKRPYIYYKNKNNEVVQVTEVKKRKNGPSLFKHAKSVGPLNVFMYALKTLEK